MVFPEKVGYDLARESLMTGESFEGSALRSRGLLQRVLPRKEVLPAAMNLAKSMTCKSRDALVHLKRVLSRRLKAALAETYRLELAMHEQTFVPQLF